MGFFEHYEKLDLEALRASIERAGAGDVERALSREHPAPGDFPSLFSRAAEPYLEEIARRSAAVTEKRFGKVIHLYAPLYLSNECVNYCVYCGFSRNNEIKRITLSLEQVLDEAGILYEEGYRHILLVSGESPDKIDLPYLVAVVRALHERFASLSIEIYPLDTEGYRLLGEAGVDGLALYQETYDPSLYAELHPRGPKRDFVWRLESQDRAGRAGYRSLGIGALLGCGDWRFEALMMAIHGKYLTKRYWKSRVAISFPRLRWAPGGFQAVAAVSDKAVVQMLCGLRLVMPDAEMVLSTREQPSYRDNLIGLGVTRMSAGSKTDPGGYRGRYEAGEQFRVEDSRVPSEVARVIDEKGFEPVWKDFDREFIRA